MADKTWMYRQNPEDARAVVVKARTKNEAKARIKAELKIRPKDRLPRGCSVHAISG